MTLVRAALLQHTSWRQTTVRPSRLKSKTRDPGSFPTKQPLSSAKFDFPCGEIVETVNGVKVRSGTARFRPGKAIFLDGSAQCPGQPFATASSAAYQETEEGFVLIQHAMPGTHPRSAASAEFMALGITLHVLNRGGPDGPFQSNSIELVTDCQAVQLISR